MKSAKAGRKSALDRIVARINAVKPRKNLEAGTFSVESSDREIISKIKYVVTTGIQAFDDCVGGVPFGRISEWYGLESCLDGDTFISYEVRTPSGKTQNSKGGSLEHLYERFHGIYHQGLGYYQRQQTIGSDFWVSSVDERGCILMNRVIDVVKTGVKECYEVKTRSGRVLNATLDHKFLVKNGGYARLSELRVGDSVFIHANTTNRKPHKRIRYAEIMVKYHPNWGIKKISYSHKSKTVVGKYTYRRGKKCNAVVEAEMNGMSFDEYTKLLNSADVSKIKTLKFLPAGHGVHHINENSQDDSLGNLMVMKQSDHFRHHAIKNDANLRFISTPDRIVSIKPIGLKNTYDIKCAAPNHNYVANGIVVHNCGKTAMAIRSAVRAQQGFIFERVQGKNGVELKRIPKNSDITVLYIDNEHSLDDDAKIVVDGTRLKCVLGFCDTIHQLFKVTEVFIDELEKVQKETGREQFLVVVVDTIAGTSSHQEMTSEWGKEDYARQPKQLREGFRIMHSQINRANVCMICLNQVSDSFKPKVIRPGFRPSNTPQDSDYTTFGGRALKYWSSQRVFMYQTDAKYKLERGSQFTAGFNIGFYTVKNRMAGQFPAREGRMPLLFGHGFHNELSILEHMLFLGLAEYEDGGMISFRFKANGIETKTFSAKETATTLEEDDLGEEKKKPKGKNPKINSRAEFLVFYKEHKEDLDALLEAGKRMMFTSQAVQSPTVEVEMDVEAEVEELEPESTEV